MRKLFWLFLLLPLYCQANGALTGYCEKGGQVVTVASFSAAQKVQGSFPQCSVKVLITGTLTLATIYSDGNNTPLANPFTADTNGRWLFYAADGKYTVVISGVSLPLPLTLGDFDLLDPQTPWGFTVANTFSGANGGAQINSAASFIGSASGLIWASPTLNSTGTASAIPNNWALWDWRDNGRLSIRTNPTSVITGSSAALSIRVGAPNWALNDPPVGSPVALYGSIVSDNLNSASGALGGLFGMAFNNNIHSGFDVYSSTGEFDANNFSTAQPSVYGVFPKYGLTLSSGGTKQPTSGILCAAGSGAGAFYHCMSSFGTSNDFLSYEVSPNAPWNITQAITASASPQTVTTNYNTTTQAGLYVGSGITVDSGGSQEDVTITAITVGATASITGTFSKNHVNPTAFYPYAALRGIDFGNAVFFNSALRIGNIQKANTSGSASFQGFTINDSSGTERLFDYFNGSNLHGWRDVGGGFQWETTGGTILGSLSSAGILRTRPSTGNNLYTQTHNTLATGVNIVSANDANNAAQGLEITGSAIELDGGNVGVLKAPTGVALDVNGSINSDVNITATGTIDATGGFKAGAAVGVSCTAGTVNLTTFAVAFGIVTHC